MMNPAYVVKNITVRLFCILCIGTLFANPIQAQESAEFAALKKYYTNQPPTNLADTNWLISLIDTGGINYLLPIRQAMHREKNKAVIDTPTHTDMLADAVCRLTDYKTTLFYEKQNFQPLSAQEKQPIQQLANLFEKATRADAGAYVYQQAYKHRVTLLNASYLKPATYAWIAGLLDSLYQLGYRHLALEILGKTNKPLQQISLREGIFVTEPVVAACIRKAISMGFQVVSCAPDYTQTIPNNARKIQAVKLGEYIRELPTQEKCLVITQPGNNALAYSDSTDVPMGVYLSAWLQEKLLSIDQCFLTENSLNEYGAFLYSLLQYKNPVNKPTLPMLDGKPLRAMEEELYSAMIWHPSPAYPNNRPVWMSMQGWRKEMEIPAAFKNSFLIQAYHLDEIKKIKTGMCIPADQTYQAAPNGLYYLYLHKGTYRIVYRNKEYAIVGYKDIEVNN
jgi:hypothetical protein